MTASMERLCDWMYNKDPVWVHGDRITDGHVALDMRVITGLDPAEVAMDGQWVIRKAQPSRWLAEKHPDLSDILPASGDEPGWSEVAWSAWVRRGVRVGAVHGEAVAVDHAWLSRLQVGYRLEGAPGHSVLRIVSEEPEPALLFGDAAVHRTVVGVVTPTELERPDPVIDAIVTALEPG